MAAISFYPPAFVHTAWLGVQQEAPQIARVDKLVDYFTSTWVNGQFQVRQWNYYKVDGPRTNNHVESWHSRLKKTAHLNVYELVEVIKREESNTTIKVQQLLAGASLAPRRRRFREKERIQSLFQRFELGTSSIDDCLEMVKHLTGLLASNWTSASFFHFSLLARLFINIQRQHALS